MAGSWTMRRLEVGALPRLVTVVSAGLLAGCAGMQSTPRQEYVWEMGRQCEHVNSGWQLDRVDSDGRYYIRGLNVTSSQDFQACMNGQFAKHPYDEWLKAHGK